jgi:hypothetical protein
VSERFPATSASPSLATSRAIRTALRLMSSTASFMPTVASLSSLA